MSEGALDAAADRRASYDYRSDDVDRPGMVDDLDRAIDGEVRFDTYTRQLYATDASLYEVTPIGVVFPTSTADVVAVVEYCAERGVPLLPRGGGTSLAGQTVNEAVVLDFSRNMNAVRSADPDARTARAQPGITLGELNRSLEPDGLKFAPDPAWSDKSVLGGAIGNNSTGSHSLKYGKTDAYLRECEVVLADGTVTTFGEITREELAARADPDGDLEARIYAQVERVLDDHADAVEAAYPDLKRNVSGYNLDWVIEQARGEDGTVDVAALLAGSEGTLAIVTEATVDLEPVPETRAMALLAYDGLLPAVGDVAPILEHGPAAVEVLDDVLLDLAADSPEFAEVAGILPDGTRSVLLVEFYADSTAEAREMVDGLVADRLPDRTPEPGSDAPTTDDPTTAFDALEAYDEEACDRFWKLRKSGLPILLSRTTDAKHVSFIEDTAIPPGNLEAYVSDFRDVLDDHDTYASFYAHAGPGVLHIRPLIDTKTVDGVERMESIADAVTDLVVEYDGSVSGEHGDGRARTQWTRKLYGDDIWALFQDLKTAFDPDWLLNPGQVVGVDADDGGPPARRTVDMTENLRSGPEYAAGLDFEPSLQWDNDNGVQGMVELCHGCGGCRGPQETTGGVMCPTYRATREEITSTRGRANMLRQAMSGDLPDGAFSDEFVEEVLDLCIGCKGCAHDCPSGVDMAKLKAEFTQEYHRRHGASLRDRLFANIAPLSRVGSAFAPLSNLATKLPGSRALLEKAVGIARERPLPTFHRETLAGWFEGRGGSRVPEADAERTALLFADTYTNYNHPETGKAAVRVLEAAGVHVRLADIGTDSGRPAFSKGFVEQARSTARENVADLAPLVRDGWDVVVVEPSDAVMFQSDYLDLLPGERAHSVAENTYGVCEYLDTFRLDDGLALDAPDGTVAYHGHCHQKATKKDHHAVGVLRRAGYGVDPIDSGCCGMAGSFGYEAEHYSLSSAIGDILYDQVAESGAESVTAPGASCRSQLLERPGSGGEPPHPVQLLEDALAESD